MKYYKYVDMYGYGIKDADFHNAWGDSRVLIKTKNKFSLRKSFGLSSSENFVRFITQDDAQNFIDNFLMRSSEYSSNNYVPYKVKKNKTCALLDENYKVYITTYQIPSNISIAVLDKSNNLVKDESDNSHITIDDFYNLLTPQVGEPLIVSPMLRDSMDKDYFDYFFQDRKYTLETEENNIHSIHLDFTFISKNISLQDQDVIDLSGCLNLSARLFHFLYSLCYLEDIEGSESDYLYGQLKDLIYCKDQDNDAHIYFSLSEFKSYMLSQTSYADIDNLVRKYFESKLINILFDTRTDQNIKDLFDRFKKALVTQVDKIVTYISEFYDVDLIESYIPSYITEELPDTEISYNYKVIEKNMTEYPQAYVTDIVFINKKIKHLSFIFRYRKENAPFNPICLELNIYSPYTNSKLSEEEKYIYIKCNELFEKIGFKPIGGAIGKTYPYNKMYFKFILENCKHISSMAEFEELVELFNDTLEEYLEDIN